MKIAIICGGPSLERGISLNSARSVMDHIESENVEIIPIYFDDKKRPYKISKAQLYSNTPSDFDFKLQKTATPLSQKSLVAVLKKADIVFPIMHGPFGEDGGIQKFLEENEIPFVGSGSTNCKKAFDKFTSNQFIRQHGFFTLPSVVLKIYGKDHKQVLEKFFKENNIQRAAVKPASGGSSIGVFSVSNSKEALEKVNLLFSKRMDTRVVVEQFASGFEFTLIILENRFGLPVALPPTEIETDYTENQIFDFRRKYLPTRQVTWHCPPRFDDKTIEKIEAQAEQLFALFGLHDFGRFDGWVLPDGNIWFCDFNTISGMEQNSFLFQQASRVGLTHTDVLLHIIKRACDRQNIKFIEKKEKKLGSRKRVDILMGGENSERQVSLMSGTNVWLKLRGSKKYEPHPYLLDGNNVVWQVPYHLCLNHTVEEIVENCQKYPEAKSRLSQFENRARLRLGLNGQKESGEFFPPQKISLKELVKNSEFIFLALHGGDGENGVMQKMLADQEVKFNGPLENESQLCMDKWETSKFIKNLKIEGVSSIPGKAVGLVEVLNMKNEELRNFWKNIKKELGAETLIIKPCEDGCTTGIAKLHSPQELEKYLEALVEGASFIPKNTFKGQLEIVEMPSEKIRGFLLEKFIETDLLRVRSNKLKHQRRAGWVEMTVGVVEENGKMKAMNPSITVAEGEVLTVEEKFQGGTGVNITPPPESIVKRNILQKIKSRMEELAEKIGLRGYSRIDIFANIKNGNILVIEVNTLPGLTPSTVFYHQALAEKKPIFPRELLEKLIANKGY